MLDYVNVPCCLFSILLSDTFGDSPGLRGIEKKPASGEDFERFFSRASRFSTRQSGLQSQAPQVGPKAPPWTCPPLCTKTPRNSSKSPPFASAVLRGSQAVYANLPNSPSGFHDSPLALKIHPVCANILPLASAIVRYISILWYLAFQALFKLFP